MNNTLKSGEIEEIRGFKTWSISLGVGLIVLGLLTIAVAGFTTLVTVIFLGLVLAVRGIVDVVHSVGSRHEKGFWWRLFGGTLSLVIGTLLLSRPVTGIVTLTFLIAVFLITAGLFRAIAAPIEHSDQWGWVMFGGIVSLILGFIVLSGWPVSSVWFVGLIIGIEILIQGIVMVTLPFAIRRVESKQHAITAH